MLAVGDALIKRDTRVWVVVALCADPSRAWVVDKLHDGLVDGNERLIDLTQYVPLPAL
jgi:hypothetical protein